MKSPSRVFFPSVLFVCACSGAFAALPIKETFDQKPAAPLWNLSAQAKVLDGELILDASGPAESYPTTAISTARGDAELNFLTAPIELELVGIDVTGTAIPANSVFMAILAADNQNEMRAKSYLKLRLSGDGTLLFNCAEIGGDRTRETTLQTLKVELPVRRLTLRVSAEGFQLKGIDASRPFDHSAGWNGRLDLAVWKDSTPFLTLKSVRRPGEGAVSAQLGEVTVRAAK